jgi:hypothetical protein
VLGQVTVTITISTDKQSYNSGDTVRFTGQVRNSGDQSIEFLTLNAHDDYRASRRRVEILFKHSGDNESCLKKAKIS